jgi:hypothetical protein
MQCVESMHVGRGPDEDDDDDDDEEEEDDDEEYHTCTRGEDGDCTCSKCSYSSQSKVSKLSQPCKTACPTPRSTSSTESWYVHEPYDASRYGINGGDNRESGRYLHADRTKVPNVRHGPDGTRAHTRAAHMMRAHSRFFGCHSPVDDAVCPDEGCRTRSLFQIRACVLDNLLPFVFRRLVMISTREEEVRWLR